ncbi:MAG TPA: hypothetical protein VIK35_09840 [Verrucomicrobiae bacterium]
MNTNAVAKIQMLKSSMKCFVFGLLSLLPVIGLPFALAALWISGRVRVKEKRLWNAARSYRIWGAVCAAAGTIFWGFILMLVLFNAANRG